MKRSIEKLGPYPSLLLLALPVAIGQALEARRGGGSSRKSLDHWHRYGRGVLRGQHSGRGAAFRLVKPKLLVIPWF
ncbi:hypothetical protein ACWAUC_10600 [Bradyrhizobium guangdongense]